MDAFYHHIFHNARNFSKKLEVWKNFSTLQYKYIFLQSSDKLSFIALRLINDKMQNTKFRMQNYGIFF